MTVPVLDSVRRNTVGIDILECPADPGDCWVQRLHIRSSARTRRKRAVYKHYI